MIDRCEVLMRRVPTVDGQAVEAHAHLQRCGRPVATDGVCSFHFRQQNLDPSEPSLWQRALKRIGRS